MSALLESLNENLVYTQNGAKAFKSTKSAILDFFAMGGAFRQRSDQEITDLFEEAWKENAELALKALFYLRDIRGGQGERRTFTIILKWLGWYHPNEIRTLVKLIPIYGRWDDLYALSWTETQDEVIKLLINQLAVDRNSDNPSLMGKWLKSENASSPETKRLATLTREAFGMSPREYRRTLSSLRQKIDVVERKMTAQEWNAINYEAVPSCALVRYKKAFLKQDRARFVQYIKDVANNNAKQNAGALYPYDIVRQVFRECHDPEEEIFLDNAWNNLPNYIGENAENMLAVVDVSGSMFNGNGGIDPINISISLGIYLAEKNKGTFKNHFITFSEIPTLVEIAGDTIADKCLNIQRSSWGMKTNIEAAFDLILTKAVDNNLPQSELPSRVVIISDMEFNKASNDKGGFLFRKVQDGFEGFGYKCPGLVFWNVNSIQNQNPMTMNDQGVQLVSGASPAIFKALLAGEMLNAYDLMLSVLESDRYEAIKL